MTSPSSADEIPTAVAAPVGASPARGSGQGGGPGRTIRAAREKAALTLESLAAQTRLARGTLEALERDDFGTLNEPVYVKGYYRKCAKVLGLSDVDLIAAYEQLVGPRQPQAPTKLLLAGDRGLGKGNGVGSNLRWLWVVIVAALFGGVAYWLSANPSAVGLGKSSATGESGASSASGPTAPETSPATPLHPVTSSNSTPSPSASEPASSTAPSTSSASAPVPAHPAAPTAAPAPAAATPPSPAATSSPLPSAASTPAPATAAAVASEEGLSLSFKGTSWVRIEDANGKALLSGVIQAGDRKSVQGKPPYSVFLGNGPGVNIEFGGKPFDVTPYVNKQTSTARFSVPQ